MSLLGRTKTCFGLDVTLSCFSYSHCCAKAYEIYRLRKYSNIGRCKNSFSLCLSALKIFHLDLISEFRVFFSDTTFRLCSASSTTFSNSHTHIKSCPTAASAHLPTIQSAPLSHDASHWHNGEKIRFLPPQGLCSGADCSDPESLFQAL